MRALTFGLAASMSLAVLAGCNGPSGSSGGADVGRAQIALTNVPADGTCVQVVAAGYRTVTLNFAVPAGASSVFEMDALPLGQVTFSASAFGGACPPAPGTVANWISDAPFVATIVVDPPALVTLNLVRNGNANVSIGFDDGPDGGLAATGGGTTTDAGTGGGATGGLAGGIFMAATGVTGEATAPDGTTGDLTLESFTFGSQTPTGTATSGAGAGAGKTTFAASAKLRFQSGVPDLYGAASKGTHFKTVSISTFSKGSAPILVWKATLTDALISGVVDGTSGIVPDLTITFVFARIDLEYDGGRNADGTVVTPTLVSFNVQTNTGAGSMVVPLQFVVGAQGVTDFESASAFRAPSEMTPTTAGTTGAGTGAGKPTFSDASVTIPLDGTALEILANEFTGRVTRTATVQIDALDATGALQVVGTYGFTNVLIDGITLTDVTAAVSFNAVSFTLTRNGEMVSFP